MIPTTTSNKKERQRQTKIERKRQNDDKCKTMGRALSYMDMILGL